MPELPEVQTVVNGLIPGVCGKTVKNIECLRQNILQKPASEISRHLVGRVITKIFRQGKYIVFVLDNNSLLTAHLKMTGKFILVSDSTPNHKHDRLIVHFADRSQLRFNDCRTLGRINICGSMDDLASITGPIGIDPLDADFLDYPLYEQLQRKSIPIKPYLMEARHIAGIGNIYAAEALFRAKIHPNTLTDKISRRKAAALLQSIRAVIGEALALNGTSIADFRQVDDKTGEFQNFLNVYGRTNQPCKKCRTPIRRSVQRQRSTFFCPGCQKK